MTEPRSVGLYTSWLTRKQAGCEGVGVGVGAGYRPQRLALRYCLLQLDLKIAS